MTYSLVAGVQFATPPLISSHLSKNVTFVTLHGGGVFTPRRFGSDWHFWRLNLAPDQRGFVMIHLLHILIIGFVQILGQIGPPTLI